MAMVLPQDTHISGSTAYGRRAKIPRLILAIANAFSKRWQVGSECSSTPPRSCIGLVEKDGKAWMVQHTQNKSFKPDGDYLRIGDIIYPCTEDDSKFTSTGRRTTLVWNYLPEELRKNVALAGKARLMDDNMGKSRGAR